MPWLPPGDIYNTYLGVELTATLDLKADLAAAGARIHDKAAVISVSPASIRQKMMLLGGNAVMAAAWSKTGLLKFTNIFRSSAPFWWPYSNTSMYRVGFFAVTPNKKYY